MKEIQGGYDGGCPACGFTKLSYALFHKAKTKTWWRKASPAYLEVSCLACRNETWIKPGTANFGEVK